MAQPDPAARMESLLAEARRAEARSDFPAAAASYRQALAMRPDLAELWSNLGLMQHESGEYVQAEEAFRRALRLDQSLFVPNLFLGLDLLQLKRPSEAVPYLLAAEKLNPQDPQASLALGRAFHVLWEPDKSRQWYQRATVLAPQKGEGWYGLGLAYFGLAEAAGARLTRAFPESGYVAELAANAFAEQGRLAEAILGYRDLLVSKEALPRCSRTSYGFVLLRHGDRAQAEQEFRRDLASCPAAQVGKARLLFDGGDREKALAILAELANSDPEAFHSSLPRFWEGLDAQQLDVLLVQVRQSVNTMAGVVADAIRRGPASTLPPERPPPGFAKLTENDLQRLASGAFFSGDFRIAALASDRLREKYPNHPAGWYWAVRAYQKLGVAALARAGEAEPDSARIHALLGDVYQRRKMFREAREEYSKILAIAPENVAGLTGLAAAYFADGQLEEAQTTAQKALAHNPADGEINLLMAEILVAQHEYAGAERCLKSSLHVRADVLPRVHALMGRVFARTGRPKEAIEELKLGLASDEDGSVYYQLGRLYQEAGDLNAAGTAFDKSKQLRARRHEAQKDLTPIE